MYVRKHGEIVKIYYVKQKYQAAKAVRELAAETDLILVVIDQLMYIKLIHLERVNTILMKKTTL